MAEQWTDQQKAAIFDRGGKLLVSAAAGSGKTKVLVDRLLSYVLEPNSQVNIDDFLIITYTKAAAAELRGKIAAKINEHIAVDPNNRRLQRQLQRLYLAQISTVHSFCANVLKEYAYTLDIPGDFRVADERECGQIQAAVLESVLEQAYNEPDEDFAAFLESQERGRDDRFIPEIILNVYNSAQCHLDPDGWLQKCIDMGACDDLTDASETVWGKYLIDDLHHFLDLQIRAMENCLNMMQSSSGFTKATACFSENIVLMKQIRQLQLWDDICSYRQPDFGRLTFKKSEDDPLIAEKVKLIRDDFKDGFKRKLSVFANSSAQIFTDLHGAASATRGLVKLVKSFKEQYDKAKRYRRVLDFSDLEHKTLNLLLGKSRNQPTLIAKELGKRYVEIMVDEYQDSNGVQDAIFGALTSERNNCFMVGDVKQSIYQFRLADPQIFLEKYNEYVPAESAKTGQGRKIMLSKNFRSAGSVISAVNDVFTNCMSPEVGGLYYGSDEMLYEGIPHIPPHEPEVELRLIDVQEDTYAEEAAYTAKRIQELLDGTHYIRNGESFRPITADDVVILLRSPGSVGREFSLSLERLGIRCNTGVSQDLLQTEEISALYALLQIIDNPLQDIPLLAVLSSRIFCFTADDLARIRSNNKYHSFYEALLSDDQEKTKSFLKVFDRLRNAARMSTMPELMEKIVVSTHIDSIFSALPDGDVRANNIQTFCMLVSEYQGSGQKELKQFLDYLESIADDGLKANSAQNNSGAVTLMSIHKSKGLEFPVVFLCGLSKDFNTEDAKQRVLCSRKLGLGLDRVDMVNRVRYPTIAKKAISSKIISDGISEELRVLYVAMTRARDRLIMTYATNRAEKELFELAAKMDLCPQQLLTSDVHCAGEWVLMTALRRTESGALFALGGKPEDTSVREPFWSVSTEKCTTTDDEAPQELTEKKHTDLDVLKKLCETLSYQYPYQEASRFPSKMTATQLKGRQKDQEAAENTEKAVVPSAFWRESTFTKPQVSATEYGTVFHRIMQRLDYRKCVSIDGIKSEIERLVNAGLLTLEQASAIDLTSIYRFFTSPIGMRLTAAENILREFKFSILEDAEVFEPTLKNEQILMQGVVDCAIIEDDGITVIDFKTDRVTPETLDSLVLQYSDQIAVYGRALSRIYKLPIKEKILYFFKLDQAVTL